MRLHTGLPDGFQWIVKFADDTTLVGLISGGDESAYRAEVHGLVTWCKDNNLTLNTAKTEEPS